jgi:hypothetical protein
VADPRRDVRANLLQRNALLRRTPSSVTLGKVSLWFHSLPRRHSVCDLDVRHEAGCHRLQFCLVLSGSGRLRSPRSR